MPRQNTPPADYPQAVLQQIEQLAQNIVIARKRRGESQAQWARKLGISQPTMARIERGDPSVAMASYVMCMWLINQAGGLADLIAPQNDHAALEKEVAKVKNQRKKKKPEHSRAYPTKVEMAASPTRLPGIVPPETNPSAEINKSLTGATTLSELAKLENDPWADIRKSLASTTTPSDLVKLETDPWADIRKSLTSTPSAHVASPSTAAGLAALLAKTDPKKK